MRLPYYSRPLDDDQIPGRLGRLARGLNRVRAFFQRQAEVAAALAFAAEQGKPVVDVLDTCIAEGLLAPVDILTQGPVTPAKVDSGLPVGDQRDRGVMSERRSYRESMGRNAHNMLVRYGTSVGQRYGTPVAIYEGFTPVTPEEDDKWH